jgi:uncharacterized phiE125 gp8 family phage protein
MGLTLSTSPTSYPVSLDEVKIDRRVTNTTEDGYLDMLIAAATDYVQLHINRQLVDGTYTLTLDSFPAKIELPMPPLDSITQIQYADSDETTQTLAASVYTVITDDSQGGYAVEATDQSWPTTADIPNAVSVTFVAGYGTPSDVPEIFKKSILLLVGEMYELRETVIVGKTIAALPSFERLLSINQAVHVA